MYCKSVNNFCKIKVGIFRQGETYKAEILGAQTEKPIFTRAFSEMILAFGFCSVVNQLSKQSIENIINNPLI
ncbi:MAG: hypothetical protein LBS01_04335 [Prevotellaceae bacterium]|jgi:hypothetical protein|nr:hypothetical protein [Prevotellaceae bacterium]